MSSRVSNNSSSLLVAPHPANVMTSKVMAQKQVSIRSNTLNGDLQNCYSCQVRLNDQPFQQQTNTHPTKRDEAHTDLQYHARIDYYLQDIKRQPWTSVRQTEHDGRYRQCCHAQVQKYVRVRVHKAIRNPLCYLFARQRINGSRGAAGFRAILRELHEGQLKRNCTHTQVAPHRSSCRSRHPTPPTRTLT
jgi:hypothetical protein